MSNSADYIYEFGRFRLDAGERLLFDDGRSVRLEPKVFEILLLLIRNRGHLIEKEELIRQIWGDGFVEENNLTRHISILRKALGDSVKNPRYIETIPTVGYRFIAAVKELRDEIEEQAKEDQQRSDTASRPIVEPEMKAAQLRARQPGVLPRPRADRWLRIAIGAVAGVALITAIAAWIISWRTEPIPGPPTPMLTYEFEVVTLNGQGVEQRRHKGSAQCLTEKLGESVSLEMVSIPGGSFLMGTSEAEATRVEYEYTRHIPPHMKAEIREWVPQEMPQRRVTVREFFLGKYEVTQAQWRVVARTPKVERDLDPEPSAFRGDNLPVTHISWLEAREFCARLSRETDRYYRLPTEAEWEYACRAGTTTPFHFGETITPQYVNYNGKYPYGGGPRGEYRGRTTPVGSFGVANAFGLYDMHGNVWEWCADAMYWTYHGAPADGSAWGSDDQRRASRVIRGGAYGNDYDPDGKNFCYNYCAFDCRSARRNAVAKTNRHHDLGFRVVMSPSGF
jgi:formylglycine-generating enzyme required for sulfatase activity